MSKNTIQFWHRRRLTKWFCWIFSLFAGKSGAPAPPQCTASSAPNLSWPPVRPHLCPPPVTATSAPSFAPTGPAPGPARYSQPTLPSPRATHRPTRCQAYPPLPQEQALRPVCLGSRPSPSGPLCALAHEAFPALLPLDLSTLASNPAVKAHCGFQAQS